MSDISNNRQLLCNSKEQKLLSKNLEYYIKNRLPVQNWIEADGSKLSVEVVL